MLDKIEAAKYVRPCEGETLAGDAVLLQWEAQGLFVAVIDVLGHGRDAHALAVRLSEIAVKWLSGVSVPSPEASLVVLHEAACGTRGAIAAAAWLDARTCQGNVAGIGNVRCRLFGSVTKSIPFGDGVLGSRMRSATRTAFVLQPGDVFLLFSDGIADRFSINDYPAITLDPGPVIAFNLVRRFGKAHDDASCAVVRCRW